jgi:hypothetical protein
MFMRVGNVEFGYFVFVIIVECGDCEDEESEKREFQLLIKYYWD